MPSFATPREQRIFDQLATQAETNLAVLRGELGAQLQALQAAKVDRQTECLRFSQYHRHMYMRFVHAIIDERNPIRRTVLVWQAQEHNRQAIYWKEAAAR